MLKLILFILLATTVSSAQTANEQPFEMSVQGATFLPSRISRVREILNGVDFRGSLPTGKGKFEIDAFFANSEGINYRIVSLDYRADVGFEGFPAFVLAGVHGDFWTPAAPHDSPLYSGGWHFGGGFMQPFAGGWSAREDFRYRLGPGTSLIIGLGLSYQFSN
jgi:hypothetical protein